MAALLVLGACATTRGQPTTAPGELTYLLTHPPRSPDVEVELRRVREGPAAFAFGTPGAIETVDVELKGGARLDLSVPSSGEVDLPNDWAVVRYRLDMDELVRTRGFTDLSWGMIAPNDAKTMPWSRDSVLLPGSVFLLRPRVPHDGLTIAIEDSGHRNWDETLNDDVSYGLETSFPWFGLHSWKLPAKELVEPGFYALGGRRRFVNVGRAKLELALLGAQHPLGDDAIIAWLTSSAAEVLKVRYDLRDERALIAVVPVLSDEASPFGRTLPSRPKSIGLLIGTEATAEAFQKDWVAVRELLRLVLPAFEPSEQWLSEGLLAYFTQAARARSGRQTPEAAWEELLDVLDHGADEAGGMRMEEVIRESGAGGRPRAIAAVGLLFVLALDARVRAASHGQKSLNDVLDVLPGNVTLAQFAKQVDATAGQPIFDALFAAHRVKQALQPRNDLIDALGVVRRNAKVTFAAPDPIRDAMMR